MALAFFNANALKRLHFQKNNNNYNNLGQSRLFQSDFYKGFFIINILTTNFKQ